MAGDVNTSLTDISLMSETPKTDANWVKPKRDPARWPQIARTGGPRGLETAGTEGVRGCSRVFGIARTSGMESWGFRVVPLDSQ